MATTLTTDVEGVLDTEVVEAPDVPSEPISPPRTSWFKSTAPTLTFIGRRLLSSALVLLGATFIVFMLLSYAIDPLEDLRTSTAPDRDAQIALRTAELHLDLPPVARYFIWLGNALRGDLGRSWQTGQSTWAMLGSAIPNTVSLVAAATILAILLGVLVGIVAALRQYTRFDYGTTFISFVLYSLPSFWVAVLLKLWGAIGFNDFLANPHISWPVIIVLSLLFGGLLSAIIAGTTRTRWISFASAALATAIVLTIASQTNWLLRPSLGIVGVLLLGVLVAFAVVALSAGLENRKALYSALTTAALGALLWWPLQFAFAGASWPIIIAIAVLLIGLGILIGYLFGGWDRRVSMRVAGITALFSGIFLFADRVMQVWPYYLARPQINNRPISTLGSSTPGLQGDFWMHTLDSFTHLLLPTLTLLLISFAGYTRYTRASMLEVMNQDYIRTARAKGLSERLVTVRHAFRNALIPLATIVPLDIAALFGGAIITERIFGWPGMGTLFMNSLSRADAAPVMGYFLVIGTLLVIASIVVDLIYAALDPRIRVSK